jgi:hypothetical protein
MFLILCIQNLDLDSAKNHLIFRNSETNSDKYPNKKKTEDVNTKIHKITSGSATSVFRIRIHLYGDPDPAFPNQSLKLEFF